MLPALEAVQAATAQSATAAEQLDLALRRAFFVNSRCIWMRHEILAAARTCDAVDAAKIAAALDAGTYRPVVSAQFAQARADRVPCSGTIIRADGTMACNPATETRLARRRFPTWHADRGCRRPGDLRPHRRRNPHSGLTARAPWSRRAPSSALRRQAGTPGRRAGDTQSTTRGGDCRCARQCEPARGGRCRSGTGVKCDGPDEPGTRATAEGGRGCHVELQERDALKGVGLAATAAPRTNPQPVELNAGNARS